MNSKASLKGTGWIQLYKKECSLDYSRHLCARKRSAELNMHNKRHSKLFGYRDTIETPKQRIAGGSSDAFQTTHTMPGGQSFARTPQVYHVEETFYRKYGCKDDETEHWASSKGLKIRGSCSYVLGVTDDDCARSFCDSVSSVACSNFTVRNGDEKMERKFTLSGRVGNFNAIVAWLQCSSSPIIW